MGTKTGCVVRIDELGSLYIYYQPENRNPKVVARTQQVNEYILIDFDEFGNIFGVELLSVPPQPGD